MLRSWPALLTPEWRWNRTSLGQRLGTRTECSRRKQQLRSTHFTSSQHLWSVILTEQAGGKKSHLCKMPVLSLRTTLLVATWLCGKQDLQCPVAAQQAPVMVYFSKIKGMKAHGKMNRQSQKLQELWLADSIDLKA